MQSRFAILKGRVCKDCLQYLKWEFASYICNIQRESLQGLFAKFKGRLCIAIFKKRVFKIYLQYQKGDCNVDFQYLKGEFVRIVYSI